MLRIVLNPREKKNITHKWENDLRLQRKYINFFLFFEILQLQEKKLVAQFFLCQVG